MSRLEPNLYLNLGYLKEGAIQAAAWLNSPTSGRRDAAGRKRVRKLLDLMKQLDQLLAPAREKKGRWRQPAIWKLSMEARHEASRLTQELTKITRFYRSWLRYDYDSNDCRIRAVHMPTNATLEETNAMYTIEKLTSAGLLDRFVLCTRCQRNWMFRVKRNQLYCGWKCRQAEYEATPERRAQRRQHQKDFYERWFKK